MTVEYGAASTEATARVENGVVTAAWLETAPEQVLRFSCMGAQTGRPLGDQIERPTGVDRIPVKQGVDQIPVNPADGQASVKR